MFSKHTKALVLWWIAGMLVNWFATNPDKDNTRIVYYTWVSFNCKSQQNFQ